MADPGTNAVAAAVPPSVAMVLTQARPPMAAAPPPISGTLSKQSWGLGRSSWAAGREIDVEQPEIALDPMISKHRSNYLPSDAWLK